MGKKVAKTVKRYLVMDWDNNTFLLFATWQDIEEWVQSEDIEEWSELTLFDLDKREVIQVEVEMARPRLIPKKDK